MDETPLYVPVDPSSLVWSYPTRDLTKKVTPEYTTAMDVGVTSHVINDTNLHTLVTQAPDITLQTRDPIDFPTGATLNEATLIVLVTVQNNDGVVQNNITITAYIKAHAAGAWGSSLTITNTFSLPALTKGVTTFPLILSVLDDVLAGGEDLYDLKVDVQQSAAAICRYTVQAAILSSFMGA